jgi:transcriptional regulator with XRE-family HTH domain
MTSREKLIELLRRQPLPLADFAASAGIAKTTLLSIINGRHEPTERTQRKAAKALGVSFEAISSDHDDVPDPAVITAKRALDLALQPDATRAKRFRDSVEHLHNVTFRTPNFEAQCYAAMGFRPEHLIDPFGRIRNDLPGKP